MYILFPSVSPNSIDENWKDQIITCSKNKNNHMLSLTPEMWQTQMPKIQIEEDERTGSPREDPDSTDGLGLDPRRSESRGVDPRRGREKVLGHGTVNDAISGNTVEIRRKQGVARGKCFSLAWAFLCSVFV
jgi:hypothetical protein